MQLIEWQDCTLCYFILTQMLERVGEKNEDFYFR